MGKTNRLQTHPRSYSIHIAHGFAPVPVLRLLWGSYAQNNDSVPKGGLRVAIGKNP